MRQGMRNISFKLKPALRCIKFFNLEAVRAVLWSFVFLLQPCLLLAQEVSLTSLRALTLVDFDYFLGGKKSLALAHATVASLYNAFSPLENPSGMIYVRPFLTGGGEAWEARSTFSDNGLFQRHAHARVFAAALRYKNELAIGFGAEDTHFRVLPQNYDMYSSEEGFDSTTRGDFRYFRLTYSGALRFGKLSLGASYVTVFYGLKGSFYGESLEERYSAKDAYVRIGWLWRPTLGLNLGGVWQDSRLIACSFQKSETNLTDFSSLPQAFSHIYVPALWRLGLQWVPRKLSGYAFYAAIDALEFGPSVQRGLVKLYGESALFRSTLHQERGLREVDSFRLFVPRAAAELTVLRVVNFLWILRVGGYAEPLPLANLNTKTVRWHVTGGGMWQIWAVNMQLSLDYAKNFLAWQYGVSFHY